MFCLFLLLHRHHLLLMTCSRMAERGIQSTKEKATTKREEGGMGGGPVVEG